MWEDLEPKKRPEEESAGASGDAAATPAEGESDPSPGGWGGLDAPAAAAPAADGWGSLDAPPADAGGWGSLPEPGGASAPSPCAGVDNGGTPVFSADGLQNPLGDILHAAIRQSMEEMVFLPVGKRPMLVASLAVLEPVRGTIQFVMSEHQARDIATAIYGCTDDELTEAMLKDATAELINTVAGQLASTLLPPDQTFSLGLPRVEVDGYLETGEPTFSIFLEVVDDIFQMVILGGELVGLCHSAADQ
jgi:hypothetical protein